MTLPLLSLWSDTTSKARSKGHLTVPFDATEHNDYGLADAVRALTLEAQEIGLRRCTLSLGHYYVGPHSKEGWRDTDLLTLEWLDRDRTAVAEKLDRQNLRYQIIPSTGKDGEECAAFVIQLDRRIDDWADHVRLATIIAHEVNIPSLSAGYYNPTFFVQVRADDEVDDRDGMGEPLNVIEKIDEHDGLWIAGKDFIRGGL